ncbi:MAG: hypothetical protein IT452_04720 [Planctomycetia bacterium]|nr:hypothetical protein [Planctomycetia bacterium]
MEMRELLQKTVEQGKWINIRETGGSWLVTLDLKGGRKQQVVVTTFEEGGRQYGRLKSRIAPAAALSSQRPTMALRMNTGLTHGSLCIDGEDLVIQETLMLAETTPNHLLASLQYIGETADRFEKTMAGGQDLR